jgi:hypothetical protein
MKPFSWLFTPPSTTSSAWRIIACIRVFGLPGDRVVAALRKYGRMK